MKGSGEVFPVGNGVSAPRALETPDPEYSEEACKAKFQGVVVLWLIVGPDGEPRDIKVTRPLRMGLDQKAIEAVNKWRFEPAMKDGRPVAVQINVEVTFRLADSGPPPRELFTKPMPKPDPKPNPSQPPFGWQFATVVSQNISFDSGAGRYMNYVEADTTDYHYR